MFEDEKGASEDGFKLWGDTKTDEESQKWQRPGSCLNKIETEWTSGDQCGRCHWSYSVPRFGRGSSKSYSRCSTAAIKILWCFHDPLNPSSASTPCCNNTYLEKTAEMFLIKWSTRSQISMLECLYSGQRVWFCLVKQHISLISSLLQCSQMNSKKTMCHKNKLKIAEVA